MESTLSSRLETQSSAETTEVKTMKKQIIALGITATLAVTAFLVGLNEMQFQQQEGSQVIHQQMNENLLYANGGDEWGGG